MSKFEKKGLEKNSKYVLKANTGASFHLSRLRSFQPHALYFHSDTAGFSEKPSFVGMSIDCFFYQKRHEANYI